LADRRDGVCRTALALLDRRLAEGERATLETLWSRATTNAARRAIAEAMLRLPPWPALLGLLGCAKTDQSPHGAAASALMRWRPEHRAYYAASPPPAGLRGRLDEALASAATALPREIADQLRDTLARWPL
jgi:hypothetical protein